MQSAVHQNEHWWLMLKKITPKEYLGWALVVPSAISLTFIFALLFVATQLRADEELGQSNDLIKEAILLILITLPCMGLSFFLLCRRKK
jgi:hypothetical protein